jgi:hypothetical protein
MAEEGVIFSDGMLDDALPFNAGTRAEVRVADGVGRLVVSGDIRRIGVYQCYATDGLR